MHPFPGHPQQVPCPPVLPQQYSPATDDQLLESLKAEWDDHRTTLVMIRDILMYMDRNYLRGLSDRLKVLCHVPDFM